MTCCLSKPFKDVEKLLRKAILGSDGECFGRFHTVNCAV